MMKVSDLIRGLPIRVIQPSDPDAPSDQPSDRPSGQMPEVFGVTHDSRLVEKGDLYVALIGERFDGRTFAGEARRRGAAAILSAGGPPEGYSGPWLEAEDPRGVMGSLASRIYGHPDRELVMVGITGTNGKSTVTALVTSILEAAGHPTVTLGTLGYSFREHSFPGERTTPEATQLFRTLRQARDSGAEAAAMEVSSHALAQGRVSGARFDVAAFTNLTRDHFDYHRGFDDYFAAKRRLFSLLKVGGRAVVNVDDPYGRRLADDLEGPLTVGAGGEVAPHRVRLDEEGIEAVFTTPRGELEIRSSLVGRYNLENLSVAVAIGEALAAPHAATVEGIALQGTVPGRLERVDRGQDFPVYVDYAHTDAALEAALRSVRELGERKVMVVFGCGGGRDTGKRVLMGRVAGKLADLPIVTSDNPRDEDPLAIISEVEQGLRESGNTAYRVVPDRREAIGRAIHRAGPEWAVVVAGKGHERVQILGDRALEFSDREEIERALEERLGQGKSG